MSIIRLEVSDEFETYYSTTELSKQLMEYARGIGLIVTKCELVEEVGHL